ncbi:NXPE family member 3-like isoform X3 [Biomphalaria glabrata]|uniref:NXPE family member 3-like isoform X3 n=1 Tax=Biomphalaria glabrata TaxID=6526 RepID=A0A9W2ZCR5_BIOGL|nr:NXPE family member 3-like isoform X3 [Biomphalaria glabrata]XP_055872839.1 NXPE family member 3-like isoform X3 [Biomphalaria glabrata]XP_055872840.1 NXPE family member 3-like isoform X3 [Biomphalaria glabrata]KAI8751889.1 NXPE family member 3-like [Biomphalaria glabrata]
MKLVRNMLPWRRNLFLAFVVLTLLMTYAALRYINIADLRNPSLVYLTVLNQPVLYKERINTYHIQNIDKEATKEIDKTWVEVDKTWPSLQSTSITLGELQEKYNRCKSVSVRVNSECKLVHSNFSFVWKSHSKSAKTNVDDFNRMNLASSCCAYFYDELMRPAPSADLFSWEKDYLSSPYLQNLEDIAWANHSTISIESMKDGVYSLGSRIKLNIVLFNGRKEHRTLGGDKIEVWLVSKDLKAAIAADVTDNSDGTYTAVTLLPWSGSVKVNAAIAHHRELFRTMCYIQRVFKTTHSFVGNFISGTASEATPCSPFPSLPEYSQDEMCNFTAINGFPWFCGRPVKRDYLNCSHFVSVTKLNLPSYLPLTEAEEKLLNMTETQRPFLIPNNITIKVVPADASNAAKVLPPPQEKCNQRSLAMTFEERNSDGFFYKGKWRPLNCELPNVDLEFLLKCLSNTMMILVGDSNGRAQYTNIIKMVPCVEKIKMTSVAWHAPLRCENNTFNISIQFYPHKLPFYGSKEESLKNEVLYSEVTILDSIPNVGKYIVYIHNFLHMVPFHLSLSEHHLKLVRQAVKRVLARNPQVIIVYQSAHSAYDRTPMNKHKMGVFLLEMQKSLLKDLGERVMFVNTWPMTVAMANSEGHPQFSEMFTDLYFGSVCQRV